MNLTGDAAVHVASQPGKSGMNIGVEVRFGRELTSEIRIRPQGDRRRLAMNIERQTRRAKANFAGGPFASMLDRRDMIKQAIS
jgi:hypothetical protein